MSPEIGVALQNARLLEPANRTFMHVNTGPKKKKPNGLKLEQVTEENQIILCSVEDITRIRPVSAAHVLFYFPSPLSPHVC